MGWRGVLRSAVAASRAAERDRQRVQRAVERGHDQLDRIVGRLDAETQRDIAKVEAFEQRIRAKPLSRSGLVCDTIASRWSFKEAADNTGQLKWKVKLEFASDAVVADRSIVNGNRTYEFVGFAATKWGAFAAFRVIANLSGDRSVKLFSQANPVNNKVFLVSNGTTYRAVEGQLDIDVPDGSSATALVAFPLPADQGPDLAIEFVMKSRTDRMRLMAEKTSMITDAHQSEGVADGFRKKLSEHTDPLYRDAADTKAELDRPRSDSGWLGLGAILLILVIIIAIAS